jgi:hypothetical protein
VTVGGDLLSTACAAAVLLLAPWTAASAQVLDDDIEFDENHVATIELDKDSPVAEGVGVSREITRFRDNACMRSARVRVLAWSVSAKPLLERGSLG